VELKDGYQPLGDDFGEGYTPRHTPETAPAFTDPNAPIWRSAQGVEWHLKDTPEGLVIQGVQDVYDLLETNKAMFTENDGWSKGEKFMRRAASIPAQLRLKWLLEEGWDAWRPDLYWDRLKRKLNSNEFRHLRTADWTL
jgi:hypothetical protein